MCGFHSLGYKYVNCMQFSESGTFLQINFDQTLTFNDSSFHHFVKEANEIHTVSNKLTLPVYQI